MMKAGAGAEGDPSLTQPPRRINRSIRVAINSDGNRQRVLITGSFDHHFSFSFNDHFCCDCRSDREK